MADITAQDIVNLGQRDRTRTSMAVTTDIDAPVDQAQRALQLSQASGVDASSRPRERGAGSSAFKNCVCSRTKRSRTVPHGPLPITKTPG